MSTHCCKLACLRDELMTGLRICFLNFGVLVPCVSAYGRASFEMLLRVCSVDYALQTAGESHLQSSQALSPEFCIGALSINTFYIYYTIFVN
jgi:hypothetical protein